MSVRTRSGGEPSSLKICSLVRWFIFMEKDDIYFLKEAYKEALLAFEEGEIPVGCVIAKDNEIISRGHNEKEKTIDVTRHAEIVAIQKAEQKLDSIKLKDCTLYVTLEPCLMCSGAILHSFISEVVFCLKDSREGAIVSKYRVFDEPSRYPRPLIRIVDDVINSEELLQRFFKKKRSNTDIE